jgi:hypothetical protein
VSNSSFHEIDRWDKEYALRKFLPDNTTLVITDNSNIILVVEKGYRGVDINFLDRLAGVFTQVKSRFKAFGRQITMTKDDAQNIANILHEQSKKLAAMSETYNLLATGLLASKNNFVEIAKNTDDYMKDILDNPFK